MECPNCGSTHLQKKGIRAGKQRYRCTKCSACFTEGVSYQKQVKLEPVTGIECPYCGSNHIRRNGMTGRFLRYTCCDCQKNFSEYLLKHPKTKISYECPYCGGELRYGGYGRKGQREYYCKNCHRSCSTNTEGKPVPFYKFSEINKDIKCPECNSINIKKQGSLRGKKRFVCKDCGRIFLDIGNNKRYLKINKQKAIQEVLDGKSIMEVSKKFEYTFDHLRKITKKGRTQKAIQEILNGTSEKKASKNWNLDIHILRKELEKVYEQEVISNEQIKEIIKYGIFLNVPVDYMAEYIHCSEHKCKDIIKKFKEKNGIKL